MGFTTSRRHCEPQPNWEEKGVGWALQRAGGKGALQIALGASAGLEERKGQGRHYEKQEAKVGLNAALRASAKLGMYKGTTVQCGAVQ